MDILNCQVSIPPNILMRHVSGESVILNLKTEFYFGLDDIGTRMWQALEQHDNLMDAYNMLTGEYDVHPSILIEDFRDLIEKLVKHELLVLRSAEIP